MRFRAALRWYVSALLALAGGVLLDLSAPGVEWWSAGLLGVVAITVALWRQRFWFGVLFGAIAGAAFWGPNIFWLTLYLGPVPWLALCAVMVLWFALMGGLIAVSTRGLSLLFVGRGWPRWMLVVAQSVTVVGLWVAREQIQSTWPYGGFAWGRLAHTQSDGPFASLVSWLGFSGLSGLLALLCVIPVAVWWSTTGRDVRKFALGTTGAVLVIGIVLALVPPAEVEQTGSLRVAAIQGDSKSGIFDDRENGDVFRSHFDQTSELINELVETEQNVDIIVWPENSAEFDLLGNEYRLQALSRLSERAGAPILAGTILADEDRYTNSAVVISADGFTGDRYDKRRPVPFAEYMPNREFFRALAPDLVDLVQLEYAFGTRNSVLEIDMPAGVIRAGIAICFDIIFDDHIVTMMADDANIIFAPTNNADFGRTDQSAQQLQIASMRAIETGRALVNISTVGTSAIVLPDGSEAARLPTHTADSMVAEVPLVTGLTPAVRFGAAVAAIWIVLGLAGAGAGAVASLRARIITTNRVSRSDEHAEA